MSETPSKVEQGAGSTSDTWRTNLPSSYVSGTITTDVPGPGDSVEIDVDGYTTVICAVLAGTNNVLCVHEFSLDGTHWIQVRGKRIDMIADIINFNGFNINNQAATWRIDVAGAKKYRLHCTLWASGTVDVQLLATAAGGMQMVAAAVMSGLDGSPISNQVVGGSNGLVAGVAGITPINSGATLSTPGQSVSASGAGSPTWVFTSAGLYVGASFIFESSSDGASYSPVSGIRMDNGAIEGGEAPTSPISNMTLNVSFGWLIPAPGANQVRVTCNALSLGSITAYLTGHGLPTPSPYIGAKDGEIATLGAMADAAALTGAGSLVALTKAVRDTLISTASTAASNATLAEVESDLQEVVRQLKTTNDQLFYIMSAIQAQGGSNGS